MRYMYITRDRSFFMGWERGRGGGLVGFEGDHEKSMALKGGVKGSHQ